MNKKDLSAFKKELKIDSIDIRIQQVYSVYFKIENSEIIHKSGEYFEPLDEDTQDIYLKNFKKILTGNIDSKIFELDFAKNDKGKASQEMLYNCINRNSSTSLEEVADELSKRIIDNCHYETDIVMTFIKGTYCDSGFIMGSVNKVTPAKKQLKFDYYERVFRATSSIDSIVNMTSPMDGFMFPAFNEGMSDVNKVIYYTSKAEKRNQAFMEDVLKCTFTLTAGEEKAKFNEILQAVIGDKVSAETMKNIYEEIELKMEVSESVEDATMGLRDLQRIFEQNGLKNSDRLSEIYGDVVGKDFSFKVSNIITKAIKLNNNVADITIKPRDLSAVRQVIDSRGRKCLVIEISEDIVINGIALENERL